MASASEKVPEVEDLKTLSAYYKAIDFLGKDKNDEALDELKKCIELPVDYKVNSLIIEARIGAAFNNKNYEAFLAAAKENLAMDSTLPNALTSVASAYACIYASKGDEDAKKQAIKYLDQSKNIDSTSADMKQYYNMIEYRIETRQIIKREEFARQFPNGWTKN